MKTDTAVYNPEGRPEHELPVIYGFNNGGSDEWYSGVLVAEDGTALGGHICSHESFMPGDLGVLPGTRPDRHEQFRAYYPRGYRMEFVPAARVRARDHAGLEAAVARHWERHGL